MRRSPAITLLLASAVIAAIGCENTAPAARHVHGADDYVIAEGWDSVALATVDTYSLSTLTRDTRDSLLAVFRSFTLPSRHVVAHE